MKTKRIVIIGGPGSGKTAIIEHLKSKGYACMEEISREVTKKAQEEGIDQLFLEKPLLFSELLLKGRLAQFHAAENARKGKVFYDRGLPDVTIYMDYVGATYGEEFTETCTKHRYDSVFILPPWQEIYKQDNERYESFEQAQELYQSLREGYEKYGYSSTQVPFGSVEERAQFIISHSTSQL